MVTKPHGTVYLVGAGPGASDLITVRGLRLLQCADIVVFDALADGDLLVGLQARCIDVGKRSGQHGMKQSEINELLIHSARQGFSVVRLKGGDPYVLGRGSEEGIALAAAGVDCQVVPGISSSYAAPLLAGIPLTHRGTADGFTVVSAHPHEGDDLPSIPAYCARHTLVVLMGVASLPVWIGQLKQLAYPMDLPIAFVTWAARADQTVLVTTLERCLADAATASLRSPSVAIVGRVVQLRSQLLGSAT